VKGDDRTDGERSYLSPGQGAAAGPPDHQPPSAPPPPPPPSQSLASFGSGPAAPPSPPSRPKRWRIIAIVVGTVVVLVAGGLVWLVLSGAKPSDLRAVARGYESVTLAWAWDEETPARSFVVMRDGEEVASVPGSETRYQDGGLAPETAYDYAVLAETEDGRSGAAEISATTTAIPAPAGLQAIEESFESVTIGWEWGDTAPSEFVILRDGEEVARVLGDTDEYRDDGLQPGTSYGYAVLAETSGGRGPAASEIVAETQTIPPISEATLSGSYQVKVAWTSATNFPGIPVGSQRTASWFFTPLNQGARLEGSMPGAGSFSMRLKGTGPTYRGRSQASLTNCAGIPGNDTVVITLRVLRGDVLQDEWVGSRWTGTFRLQSPPVSSGPLFCPAGSIGANLLGQGGG